MQNCVAAGEVPVGFPSPRENLRPRIGRLTSSPVASALPSNEARFRWLSPLRAWWSGTGPRDGVKLIAEPRTCTLSIPCARTAVRPVVATIGKRYWIPALTGAWDVETKLRSRTSPLMVKLTVGEVCGVDGGA